MGVRWKKWGKQSKKRSKHSSFDSIELQTAILRLAPIYSGFLLAWMIVLTNAMPYA